MRFPVLVLLFLLAAAFPLLGQEEIPAGGRAGRGNTREFLGLGPAPDPAAAARGEKLYAPNCAFCHGGAKAKISPMRDKFNPPVPQLVNRIPHDPDNWLFWVTKHGVRMTGMPAWDGVMSDEEMWKVIAFIKHSDKLPPDAAAAWQKLASTPGEIEEHSPEQHEHAGRPPGGKR